MRIALLSDIHGNLAALEAVVADARRRGVDEFINLGDSLSGPLMPLETASPDARYAVIERVGPSWIVDLIAVPYNHFAMANLAARNGRPDWQYALATGYALRATS